MGSFHLLNALRNFFNMIEKYVMFSETKSKTKYDTYLVFLKTMYKVKYKYKYYLYLYLLYLSFKEN